MKRSWIFLLIIVSSVPGLSRYALSAELSSQQRQWLVEHPQLNFAPAPYYPPIEYFDEAGAYRGITADFMALMAERLGLVADVKRYPSWNHVIEATHQGEVDIWGAAAYTPERDKFMAFTDPYIHLPAVIVVRKEKSGPMNMRDLQGMKVVLIRNYASAEYVKQNFPGLNYIEVPDLEAGLRMVSYSIADAIIATNAAALFYIERDGLTNLRVAGESGFEWHLRFAVREELAPLADIIQLGLNSISEDEKREIFRRWINLEYKEQMITPAQLAQAGAAVLALLVISIVIWNRTLRRKVRSQTQVLNTELQERRELEVTLRRLATTDELTGIMNRRHLFEVLRKELKRVERYDAKISLLLFDVDNFKSINDNHGHSVGDKVLRQVVNCCQEELRENDLFGRIGGEEFVIALLEAEQATAVSVANRLCHQVSATGVPLESGEILHTTISIGVVCADSYSSLEELLTCCDRAMYRAKKQGRNRVELYDWREAD